MKRTHRGDLYRRDESDGAQVDQYAEAGETPSPWGAGPHLSGVRSNLQPLTGSVVETEAGRAIGANWKGFFPAGTDLRSGDRYVVTEGVGPRSYIIQDVGPQGAPWDTEALLAAELEEVG